MCLVFFEPEVDVEVVELLCPEHASECLSMDQTLILSERSRSDPGIEVICFSESGGKSLLESIAECLRWRLSGQTQANDRSTASGNIEHIASCCFRSSLRGIDS